MIEKIIEKAKKENKKVYIYAHKNPDGDAINSSCAIVKYLKNNGINASYVITKPVYSNTQLVGKIPTTQSVDSDSISLIVDTSTLDYAENTFFLNSQPENIYVIDHHIKSNGLACIEDELNLPTQNVLRDSSASSTCEMLVNEFEKNQISPQIANMLTLGLLTDTGKLRHLKTNTLQNLQILLQSGADYDRIISMSTRKINLRDEIGLAKVLLNSQKISIGDTFGILLSIDSKTATSIQSQYGVRLLQKKIFKMSDIANCSFNCILAENNPGEFDIEFRSSQIYGNFNVLELATMHGGGGHHNASGCHLSTKDGHTAQTIFDSISQYVANTYSEQATDLTNIPLTDTDKELESILNETKKLTQNVTPEKLSKIDELIKKGAYYNYLFSNQKTFERFMLENEMLSRIPNTTLNNKSPIVNISLTQQDVTTLCQKYNINEDEILNVITTFSNINIQSASISLPDGRKTTIDRNGNISITQSKTKANELAK